MGAAMQADALDADALDACASTIIFLRKKLFIKAWSCDLDLRTFDVQWS